MSNLLDESQIKDKIAYDAWQKYQAMPALHYPERLIQTSDNNLVIDPFRPIAQIAKQITHLPLDEQDEINRRVRAVKIIHNKATNLKHKAFGIRKSNFVNQLNIGLLDERQAEIVALFGRMLTNEEVHKIITVEWGYDVPISTLINFKKRHHKEIKKAQSRFQQKIDDIRLAHKKGRLEELVYMYTSRKHKYEQTQSKSDYQLMLQTLRAIRDEVEDKRIKIDHNITAQLEITINHHIQDEVMKGLTINDIIVARVAARMNINPRFLISRLHNSYYAKYSGFVRPDDEQDEVVFPSSMVYNWDKIKQQHKTGDTNLELQKWDEPEPTVKKQAMTTKQRLMMKLRERKRNVEKAQARVENVQK